MAKAIQPAVTASGISFELDRFEFGGGGRLELSGRWFGVRGRRFMRPTLTLALDGERHRALADLEHKPWAAEDGEPWHASFPWPEGTDVLETELSVAPDITVCLPALSAALEPAQRFIALPREEFMSIGTVAAPRPDAAVAEQRPDAPVAETGPEEAREPSDETAEVQAAAGGPTGSERSLESELKAVRAELEAAQLELSAALARRDAAVADVERAIAQRDQAVADREQAAVQRDDAVPERDRAISERDRAVAERDGAIADVEQAIADLEEAIVERDEAIAQQRQAITERDQAQLALATSQSALADAQTALGRAAHERDEAITVHGAALVMRNATRALPAYQRHVGWFRRGLLIAVLLGAAIALLTVLHVL